MKVGIISDTHISKKIDSIDRLIEDYFYDVDTIIHVGDFNSSEVIKRIKSKKKFIGVYGNNDSKDIRNILPIKDIIKIEGYKVGLFHGHGSGKNTLDRAYDEFKDDKVDIIIFGHSHQPIIRTRNKVLMINPGSPMKKLKERWYSYVLLQLNKKKIEAKMVLFKKK